MSRPHRDRDADRDRERDRRTPVGAAAPSQSSSSSLRLHDWFLADVNDEIDREVISADICRYLGNNALVKPRKRESVPGWLITAPRPLTTEMIKDIKLDSAKWKAERGKNEPKDAREGPPSKVGYRDSAIHEKRQLIGPSGDATGYSNSSPTGRMSEQDLYSPGYGSAQNYSGQPEQGFGAPSAGYGAPNPGYDAPNSGYGVPSSGYGVPTPNYGAQSTGYGGPPPQDNYSFVHGSNYATTSQAQKGDRSRNPPLPPTQAVPRGGSTAYPDSRGNVSGYYPPSGPQGQPTSQYPPQSGDAYYGRQSTYIDEHISLAPSDRKRAHSDFLGPVIPGGYDEPMDDYPDNRQYEQSYEQPQYSQPQMPSSTTATANQGAPRRGGGDRERDQDPRDRHRSHGSSRSHGRN